MSFVSPGHRGEQGFSIFETVVAVSLLTAVVAVMGPIMTSAFRSGRVVQNESRAIDELRVAVARIDRELRSADEVYVPTAGAMGPTLSFRTYADGSAYDVTYSVSGGQLVRTTDTETQYVGSGLVTTSQEFGHEANPGQRSRLTIDLQVQFEASSSPRRIQTTIAGRNAW